MMVPRVLTGGNDRAAWLRRIFLGAQSVAPRFFAFADETPEGRAALVNSLALSVAVLCDWQSGEGRDEYNFNPAWLSPPSDAVPYFQLSDGRKVAAFPSLADGLVRLFQSATAVPRARELMAAGFVSWARWFVPGTMDQPPDSRASFDAYMARAREVSQQLLQAPLSEADIANEWEAWSGRYVSDDSGSVPAEEEPATAPPRTVRPGFAWSTTLGREVANGSCVQSRRDRRWYQARAGEWALCPGGTCPVVCVERYPLAAATVATGSSGSSVGPFLLLGAGWALWWAMGRK